MSKLIIFFMTMIPVPIHTADPASMICPSRSVHSSVM